MKHKKPGPMELFFFLAYCKARKSGNAGRMEETLRHLRLCGFDVKDIEGRWCLVGKNFKDK